MNITIYTRSKPECAYCAAAKALLEENGLAYEEIDVSKKGFDLDHLKTVIAPGATTLPVIFVDEDWIGGYTELVIHIAEIANLRFSRQALREKMQGDVVSITFQKTDGSIREMTATLNQAIIPVDKLPKTTDTASTTDGPKFDKYIKVFDITSQGWRSVNLTTIKRVKVLT